MTRRRLTAQIILAILGTVLLTNCTPRVSPAAPSTLKSLYSHSLPPPPKGLRTSAPARLDVSLHLPPNPTVLRLPLLSNLNLPAVPALINGLPVHLILDSGAVNVPVLVEPKSAVRLGLRPLKGAFLKGSGVGGSVKVSVGRFESVSLANHPLFGPGYAGILLQSYTETIAGIPVRTIPLNILGMKALSVFSYIAIDSPAKQVELGIHTPYQPGPGAASFDFEIRNDGLHVDLLVGATTIHALLDTGCSSPLNLTQKDVGRLPGQAIAASGARMQKSMGIAGLETSRSGTLREVRLGNIRLSPVEFDSSPSSSDSLLGWGAFRNRRIVLDFLKKRVWVEEAPSTPGPNPAPRAEKPSQNRGHR